MAHKEDFFSKFEVFDYDNYLYLLYGMNYPTETSSEDGGYNALAKAHANKITEVSQQLNSGLPGHRELLNKIKEYGLQTI